MISEQFIVDDAGTLIDMKTRDTYDTAEEVVDLLNYYKQKLDDTIDLLNKEISTSEKAFDGLMEENKRLRMELSSLKRRHKFE